MGDFAWQGFECVNQMFGDMNPSAAQRCAASCATICIVCPRRLPDPLFLALSAKNATPVISKQPEGGSGGRDSIISPAISNAVGCAIDISNA